MRIRNVIFLVIPLVVFSGCASARDGGGVPFLKSHESGTTIQGRWINPEIDPVIAFNKVERGKTSLQELRALGFDFDAQVIGGNATNSKDERERLLGMKTAKPTRLEGPEAYELYFKMLFPGGGMSQVITPELIEQRQAEVGRYLAGIFSITNVRDTKDRIWFSTLNKFKVGYKYVFTFVLKDGVVIQKSKKEETFNDHSTEEATGGGAVEFLKGVKQTIPIPWIP